MKPQRRRCHNRSGTADQLQKSPDKALPKLTARYALLSAAIAGRILPGRTQDIGEISAGTLRGFVITAALHGAIWDGETLMLSLTLEGEDVPADFWTNVKTEDSYLSDSKAQMKKPGWKRILIWMRPNWMHSLTNGTNGWIK